jgi:hypothetical protein
MPNQVVTNHLEQAQEMIVSARRQQDQGSLRGALELLADALEKAIQAVYVLNESS